MLAEVAAVGAVPFIVLLDQDVSGEAEQRRGVRERADDVGAAFDLLVHPLERVGGPDLPPVLRAGSRRTRGCRPWRPRACRRPSGATW